MTFLQFVEGPLFYVAAAIFVVGVVYRLIGILRLGGERDLARPNGSAIGGAIFTVLRHFVPRRTFWRGSSFHFVTGYAFHIGLFVLLLLAAPHVAFLQERILGFGWPVMPRWAFVLTAEVAFAGLILLWVRRFVDPVQKLISTSGDYAATILTFLVMLTGCLALQESHVALRATHMVFVDIWLIYFPFSRLIHTFTFFFSRAQTGATYGRRGAKL
ncbi:hypothetical protein [Profundibacter sp.]|uniref:hypothetical protein n=1 Tax=Profundibacter sp. TaxID=3101071 RepID=UPI003D0DA054